MSWRRVSRVRGSIRTRGEISTKLKEKEKGKDKRNRNKISWHYPPVKASVSITNCVSWKPHLPNQIFDPLVNEGILVQRLGCYLSLSCGIEYWHWVDEVLVGVKGGSLWLLQESVQGLTLVPKSSPHSSDNLSIWLDIGVSFNTCESQEFLWLRILLCHSR